MGYVPIADAFRFTSDAEYHCDQIDLTNADIKALPNAPLLVAAAPGSGRRIVFLDAVIEIDTSASGTPYTNIDAAAYLRFVLNGDDISAYLANDAGITPAASDMDQLFGTGSVIAGAYVAPASRTNGVDAWDLLAYVHDVGSQRNQPLYLVVDNSGAGSPPDFTGGDAQNSGRVVVRYLVI